MYKIHLLLFMNRHFWYQNGTHNKAQDSGIMTLLLFWSIWWEDLSCSELWELKLIHRKGYYKSQERRICHGVSAFYFTSAATPATVTTNNLSWHFKNFLLSYICILPSISAIKNIQFHDAINFCMPFASIHLGSVL